MNTVHHGFDKKYQWIEKKCYNFDERSTDLYIRKLEETLENGNVNTIEEFNMMIEDASNQTLKRSYKQRIIMNNDKIIAKEPPWINAQIRSGIKKRKQLNRENLLSDIVKIRIKKKQWKNILIKRRRYKLTYMMQCNAMQCNAMQTIDKLRGKSTILYDCDGKLLRSRH